MFNQHKASLKQKLLLSSFWKKHSLMDNFSCEKLAYKGVSIPHRDTSDTSEILYFNLQLIYENFKNFNTLLIDPLITDEENFSDQDTWSTDDYTIDPIYSTIFFILRLAEDFLPDIKKFKNSEITFILHGKFKFRVRNYGTYLR